MKRALLTTLLLATASTTSALDSQERSFFGLTALETSHPHLTGEGLTIGVSDTEFDVTHPGLGWTGGKVYTEWFNNQSSIPHLNRTNPRIFMSAHREYAAKAYYQMKHGYESPESFTLPVSMNNPLKPLIWGYHGTWVTGAAASGERGPFGESLGAAPKARLVLAGDTENFNLLLSLVPDGNPNRTVVMNRSFTGWSMIDGTTRRNSGVIGVNAAGNSFSYLSADRMIVGGYSPHRASVRWVEQHGYDLVVSGLTLETATIGRAEATGSQRNQETIFTDYVVKTIGPDNAYDQSIGGTSLASPFLAGGATLVQQAYINTHTGRWLRVSQMDRILKRSAKFTDDIYTGLRYPVADFAAAVALAETYPGDPSYEPNFSMTNLPPAVRVNGPSSVPHFLDPRFFRVSAAYTAFDLLDYTTPSNHNGVIHVTGNRGHGRVSVDLRNGWGDLARVNLTEPGKKVVLAFDYDTKAGTGFSDFNELFIGVRELYGSDQFMSFDLSDDAVANGRLAFRITYQRGQSSARVDLLQCSVLPTISVLDKYAVWTRTSWTGAPGWDTTPLATAWVNNLHQGAMPRVEAAFTLDRATLRVNNTTVIDSAHTAPGIALSRATPYLHFQHYGSNAQQRLAGFTATTEHGSKPIVTLEYIRNRAVEGVTGPAASGLLTFHRTGPTHSPLTVQYSVAGTAINGLDYAQLPGSITIPAGVATVELPIRPINDIIPEGNETVMVFLLTHSSYLVNYSFSTETVTIVDQSDADGDGLWNWDEDMNRNGDLSDDDANANLLPNYLDHLDRVPTNNVAPVALAGPARSTIGINPVTLDGTASYDPDGSIAAFAWSIIPNPNSGPVVLDNANASTPAVRWTAPSTSNRTALVRLTVTDNHGASASATTTVTQLAGQVFQKTYPQVFFRGTPNGWGTTAMALVTNYTWQLDVAVTGASSFKFDVYGDWSLNFGDNNNDGWADQSGGNIALTQGDGNFRIQFNDQTRRYTVTKIVPNVPPVAVPGANVTTYQMEPVTLNGGGSYDPDGQITSYAWSIIDGSDGPVWMTDASTATPTVQWTAPTISSRVARVRLTVTDNRGASATATTTVTQTSTITYQKTYPQVYFRGTPNGWGTQLMNLVSNYTWEVTVVVGSGTQNYKFDVYGNWSLNFGDNNNDGWADQSGGNIAFQQGAGTYTVRFNDQTRRYTATKETVNQPPVANAGPNQTINGLGGATVYLDGSGSYDPDGTISEYAWTQASGPFAIISYAHPGSPNATVVLLSQTNNAVYTFRLRVTDNNGAMSTGTVTITQQAGGFNKVHPQVYLRGSHNNWGSQLMTLVSNNVWETEANFGSSSNERFKFDVYGDWSLNFGDNNNDGIAEQSGGNIAVSSGAGTYRIRYNDADRRYTVTKIGGTFARDFTAVAVAGTMNGWNPAANNLQVIGDYTWSGTFVLSGDVQLKFAANGSWGTNWGDNDQPGTSAPLNGWLESSGGNVRLTGLPAATYRITMHERTRAYSVTVVTGSEAGASRLLVGWEARYGIDLLSGTMADEDHDQDGLSNLAEYHLGTDPFAADSDADGMMDMEEIVAATDPLDHTSLLAVETVIMDGRIELSWTSRPDRLYRVEASNDLNAYPWQPVTDWGGIDGKLGPQYSAPLGQYRYYRVRVGQPGVIGTTLE
ncbi:MAG TPA: PKD domain-containing protein [Kiritimatiellia bacterium]|nr:PKD domain-containing protein [Kiritimatiellia bacterium]HMP33106.1 PKD domain-containing protein [Kiritimatiellia bacterium]